MSNVLGPPTLAGFQAFLVAAGMNATVLPPDSTVVSLSFNVAQSFTSLWLSCIDPDIYTLAVYDLGTDRVVNFAQDQPNQTFFGGGPKGQPPGLRQQYGINSFTAGVIESAADQATSTSVAVPDSLKNLTIADIMNTKTPWGREYLSFAQMIGTLWGLD